MKDLITWFLNEVMQREAWNRPGQIITKEPEPDEPIATEQDPDR